MANRTVSVDLVANVGSYQSAMVRAASSTRAVGDSAITAGTRAQRGFDMARSGAVLLGGVMAGGLALGLKSAVDAAANAEQSIGGVEAVFKDYANSVIADSKEADRALGLSANAYRELATVIGSQLKNAGVPMEQLAGQTQDIIQIGADLAAQFGGSTQEAVQALSSAFRGELDPIERYGISLNAAAVGAKAVELGLSASETELSQNAKMMATLAIITEQSADAQGAFARESDTAAGQAQRAAAQWENLQAALGEKLLPVWSGLMDFVSTTVIPGLDAVGTFVSENTELALALAAALGVHLVGGIGAVTVALNRWVLTPAVLGLSGLLDVVLDLPGSLSKASGALAGFISAATPLAAAGGVVYALTEFVSNSRAAEAQMEAASDAGREFAATLADQGGEINSTTREAALLAVEAAGLAEAFDAAAISSSTVTLALTGNQEAFEVALAAAEALDAETSFLGNSWGLLGVQMDVVSGRATQNADAFLELWEQSQADGWNFPDLIGGVTAVGEAMGATGEAAVTAAEDAAEAQERWLEDLQGFAAGIVDPLTAYQDMQRAAAEATAEATSDASDSWIDHVDSVEVSLGELATALQTQLDNQANWRTNLAQIAQWAGADVAQYLAEMGEEGIDLVAAMADGSSAEAQRMREQILRHIQQGGDEWTAGLDNEMRAMALIGRDGSARTVQEVARQLGIGVDEVRRIARQYGIELASGVNPLLTALGARTVQYSAEYGSGRGFSSGGRAMGGFITGPGGPTDDTAGLFALSNGEYVVRAASVAKYGKAFFDDLNIGKLASGGYVSTGSVPPVPSTAPYRMPISTAGDATMQEARDEVIKWLAANLEPPAASGGSANGLLPIMAAARQYVMDTYGITNIGGYSYRNIAGTNTLSDHALGKAIDIMTSNVGLGWAIANDFAFGPAHARFRAENTIWQQSISSNGGPFVRMADRGSITQNHYDHVHVDTYDQGGWLLPGLTLAYNGTGAPERVLTSREFGGSGGAGGGYGGTSVVVHARVFIGNREITDIARVEAQAVMGGAVNGMTRRLSAQGVR